MNHRMTEVEEIVVMVFTNNKPNREFSSSATLTDGIQPLFDYIQEVGMHCHLGQIVSISEH